MNTNCRSKDCDHWSGLNNEFLDSYLIQSFENPSINPQSVLIRSFLTDHIFPDRFTETIVEELFYSACACYGLLAYQEDWFNELYDIIQAQIHHPRLPGFLQPDFIRHRSRHFSIMKLYDDLAKCLTVGFEHETSPFRKIWISHLKRHFKRNTSVLELGCGSANDFRYWSSYGIASFVDYTGIDISSANIRNAKKRFPYNSFKTASACDTGYNDNAFDIVIACDLLEHLSPQDLQSTLIEAARISRDEIWFSCFNLACSPFRLNKIDEGYYSNQLSVYEIAKVLSQHKFRIEWISIKREYAARYSDYRQYNENAGIIIASKIRS